MNSPMRTLLPVSRTRRVVVGLVLLILLTELVLLCTQGPVQIEIAVVFGAVIAVGESMRITLPGSRDNAPLAATAGFGYAMAYRIGGHLTQWGTPQVVVVVAAGAVLGSLPQILAGRPPTAGYLIRRVGVAGFIAWVARNLLHGELSHASHQEFLILFGILACIGLLLDSAWAAMFEATSGTPLLSAAYRIPPIPAYAHEVGATAFPGGESAAEVGPGLPATPFPSPEQPHPEASADPDTAGTAAGAGSIGFRRRLNRFLAIWVYECTATARVCPAVAALSVAVALAADPLGLWVLLIAAAPILVMQRALRRYAAIRATYQQTIRALSRITDLAGYTEPGHARRVCRLALAIGRELGMSESELLDLEYAALLHDLGQLSLADPLPGGATVTAAPEVAADLAARGAEVVRQTGVLDRVARLVEAQCAPYAPGDADQPDRSVDEARAAAVLRVANDFEDLCNGEPGPRAYTAALARIRLGDGRLYDPQAVAALARLVRAF